MANEVDCRGMNCPAPVLQVRNVLESGTPVLVSVLVDNDAARQNVSRLLEHNNYQVKSELCGDDFRVIGTLKEGVTAKESLPPITSNKLQNMGRKKIMVLITSSRMGHGDDGLGDMLMFNFLKTLKEMLPELWRIAFVNSGVNFTADGSEAIPLLQELEGAGVQISACGACLAFFHILDKIEVGVVTNMLEIINQMKEADTVITL